MLDTTPFYLAVLLASRTAADSVQLATVIALTNQDCTGQSQSFIFNDSRDKSDGHCFLFSGNSLQDLKILDDRCKGARVTAYLGNNCDDDEGTFLFEDVAWNFVEGCHGVKQSYHSLKVGCVHWE